MTKVEINTLQDLLSELRTGTELDGYFGVMPRLDMSKKEVKEFCTWDRSHYTRNLIEQTDDFELLLVCWEAGQKSLIHSYYDQQGWMYVIDGELVVNHFFESQGEEKMRFYKEVHVKKGRFLYVNDYLGFHSVINASKGRTISLHLHAKPVEKWKVYDPENNSFFVGDTVYHTDHR